MCGAYGFTIKEVGEAYRRWHIVNTLPDFTSRYNVRPSDKNLAPVVVHNSPNKIMRMKWGIERGWSTRPIINATAEKLSTSKLWLPLLRSTRCLVICSFFYENDKTVSPSQPYLFKLKRGDLFALAGLYEETQEGIGRYVVVTTEPNDLVSPVHPRMAAILRKEDEETWLNPDVVEPEQLVPLLAPYPASEMVAYPVTTRVNNWRNDDASLIQPIR